MRPEKTTVYLENFGLCSELQIVKVGNLYTRLGGKPSGIQYNGDVAEFTFISDTMADEFFEKVDEHLPYKVGRKLAYS